MKQSKPSSSIPNSPVSPIHSFVRAASLSALGFAQASCARRRWRGGRSVRRLTNPLPLPTVWAGLDPLASPSPSPEQSGCVVKKLSNSPWVHTTWGAAAMAVLRSSTCSNSQALFTLLLAHRRVILSHGQNIQSSSTLLHPRHLHPRLLSIHRMGGQRRCELVDGRAAERLRRPGAARPDDAVLGDQKIFRAGRHCIPSAAQLSSARSPASYRH